MGILPLRIVNGCLATNNGGPVYIYLPHFYKKIPVPGGAPSRTQEENALFALFEPLSLSPSEIEITFAYRSNQYVIPGDADTDLKDQLDEFDLGLFAIGRDNGFQICYGEKEGGIQWWGLYTFIGASNNFPKASQLFVCAPAPRSYSDLPKIRRPKKCTRAMFILRALPQRGQKPDELDINPGPSVDNPCADDFVPTLTAVASGP